MSDDGIKTAKDAGGAWDGESVAVDARKVTLEVFAIDESASVQVRLPGACLNDVRTDLVFEGDVIQNGTTDPNHAQTSSKRFLQPSQQTLRTSRHALRWS